MATKFVLTAAVKIQAPSASEVAKITTAITNSLGKARVPLKITLPKNIGNIVVGELTKVDKKLDVTTNKFLQFIQMVRNAFQQLQNISFATTIMGNLIKNINRATKAANGMAASINNTMNKTQTLNYTLGGFNQALKNIASNGIKTRKTVDGIGGSVREMGLHAAQSIKRFGTFTLITSSFLSLIHAIRASVQEAIAFEAEVIKLRQVTGQSATGIKELVDEVGRLSVAYGVSSKELLDVTVTLAQAGLTAKETKRALEAVAKASLSPSFDDMNSIVEGSIAVMQQFDIKAKDLEGTLGSMSAVAAKFAVESADLITAIRRTGGAFKAAGGDVKELFALFTSVRQTTRESAESIATGFRTIFARLQRNRTQDFLRKFGIDLRWTADEAKKFGKTANNFVGPYEAIKRLSEGLNGLAETDPRFAQIIEELGGFRQISKVIPLIKENKLAQEAYNVAIEGSGSLTEDAAIAQESLLNKLIKVREEFQLLIRSISDNDAFKMMVDNVLGLARSFIQLVSALKPVLPLLASVAALQVSRNAGQYLGGFSSGLALPSAGDAKGKTKFGQMAKSVAGSDTHLLALSMGAGALANTFLQLNNTSKDFLTGLTGIVAQFAIFRQIGSSINPFSNPKVKLGEAQTKLSEMQSRLSDLRAAAPYLPNGSGGGPDFKAVNRKQRQNLMVDIKKQENAIPGLEAAANKMNLLISAMSGLIAVTSVVSSSFQDMADAQLRLLNQGGGQGNRGGFLSSSAASGAFGYGGQGAAAGAAGGFAVGGPVGATIGGILGALTAGTYGFVTALDKAKNVLEQIDFNERFSTVGTALKSVNSGDRLASSALSDVRTGLLDLQNSLRTVSDPERRADIMAQGKNVTSDMDAYLKILAKTTGSLDEFKKLVGDDLLNVFGYLSKKSMPDFLHDIEEIIKTDKKMNDINKDSIKLEISRQESIKTQILFGSALDEAKVSVLNFNASLNSLASFAEGGHGSANSFEFGAVQTLKNGGSPQNISKFGNDLGILGAAFGGAGKEQADRALSAAKLSRELPSLLFDLVSKGGLNGEGTITDRLDKTLTDKFKDAPKDMLDSIVHHMTTLKGAGGDDTQFFGKFSGDPKGVIKGFVDVVSGQASELANSGEQLQNEFRNYSSVMFSFVKLMQNIRQEMFKLIDIKEQRFNFLQGANNANADYATARGFEEERKNLMFRGENFGTHNQQQAIGASLTDAQNTVKNIENKLQTGNLGNNERHDQINRMIEAQEKVNTLTEALKFMADAAARAAVDMQELGDLQSRRKAKLGVFTQFLGADNAGRRDIKRNIIAMNNAVQQGSLNGVRQDQRGQVLSMLESINPEKFKEILANEAKNLGIDPKGLITPDDKEKELINTIANKYTEAIKAQQLYTENLKKNSNEFITKQNESFTMLLKGMKTIFTDGLKKSLEESIGAKTSEKAITESNIANANSIEKMSGTTNISGIQRFLDQQKKIEMLPTNTLGIDQAIQDQSNNAWKQKTSLFSRDFYTQGGVNDLTSNLTAQNLGISSDSEMALKNNINNRLGEAKINGTNNFRSSFVESIIQEELKALKTKIDNDINNNNSEKNRLIKDIGGEGNAMSVLGNRASIEETLKKLPQDTNLQENNKQLMQLNLEIKALNSKLQNIPGHANGGFVAGTGNRDNTLINTTPGEFVVRKPVAQKYGNMLAMMNKTGRLPHFANGGFVGGGSGGGISALNGAITNFSLNINKMIEAFNMFPREISMQATHTVNVVHVGSQIFASLEPALVRLVEGKVSQAINNLTSKHMDIGHIADADLFSGGTQGSVNFQG